jgi:hypothetical protein
VSDLGDAIAAYGAGVATVVAVLQIRRALASRPRLLIDPISPENVSSACRGLADLRVGATNNGSVPVRLARIRIGTKVAVVWDYELPDDEPSLGPNDVWHRSIRGRDLAARLSAADPNGSIRYVTITATTGHVWRRDLKAQRGS